MKHSHTVVSIHGSAIGELWQGGKGTPHISCSIDRTEQNASIKDALAKELSDASGDFYGGCKLIGDAVIEIHRIFTQPNMTHTRYYNAFQFESLQELLEPWKPEHGILEFN